MTTKLPRGTQFDPISSKIIPESDGSHEEERGGVITDDDIIAAAEVGIKTDGSRSLADMLFSDQVFGSDGNWLKQRR